MPVACPTIELPWTDTIPDISVKRVSECSLSRETNCSPPPSTSTRSGPSSPSSPGSSRPQTRTECPSSMSPRLDSSKSSARDSSPPPPSSSRPSSSARSPRKRSSPLEEPASLPHDHFQRLFKLQSTAAIDSQGSPGNTHYPIISIINQQEQIGRSIHHSPSHHNIHSSALGISNHTANIIQIDRNSMKKMVSNASSSLENRKLDYHSPTRFPKKQFELIYREKDNPAAQQAYESIIFMKTKKCEVNKSCSKGKKQSAQALSKVIKKIEKQLKQDQSGKNKKQEAAMKSAILKHKTSSINFSKKQSMDHYKSKSSQRLTKYQKKEFASSDTISKCRQMHSPDLNIRQKRSEDQTYASQFTKTQETFRKESKNKNTKRNKKQNVNPLLPVFHFQGPAEYVLLENNFVELNPKQISVLDQKFISNRDLDCDKRSRAYKNERISYDIEELLQENEAENKFQFQEDIFESEQSSNTQNSFCSAEEKQGENNLIAVQNYLISKVTVIQKWWRLVMEKQKEKENVISKCQIQVAPSNDLFVCDSISSEVFGQGPAEQSEIIINNSPIKMVDDFEDNFDISKGELEIIISRENAAKMQMEAHKQILEKFLVTKKINSEVYIDRKEMIESKYFFELQEIEQLRRILKGNASKIIEISKKAKEDLEMFENTELQVNSSLLDKIFGTEGQAQSKMVSQLSQIPMLHSSDIVQREKSTGCHFHSDQKLRVSLYKKTEVEDEEYREDFEECQQEGKQNNNQFFERNSVEAVPNNYKELFDEFKLREEVKMQIEKRTSIQMGAMVEQVPAEIKNEFVQIETCLTSIHRFVLSFFKFYIFYYKYDFLRLINMPYGFNIDKRLQYLQGYTDEQCPEEDEDGVVYGLETVITDDLFEEFYEKVYDTGSEQPSIVKRANFEFEKIHNKAIFDCFNEALNVFRPYFMINGPPFPWTNSEKALTFYFIAEENIQEVFEKTQFKILKWASSLCGLIVGKYSSGSIPLDGKQSPEDIISVYQEANHPVLNEARQQKLSKNENAEAMESNHEWMITEDQKTVNLIQTSELLFSHLIGQIYDELFASKEDRTEDTNESHDAQHISADSSCSGFEIC